MTTPPIRTLIVDDEPLARTHLRGLLEPDPEIAIVGECGNGRDAVTVILRDAPELLFLDIQMPELDGFGVVEEVGLDAMPFVVFVTAYDEHALRAFDAHAVAYLVKPVNRDRFRATVDRVKGLVRGARADQMQEPLTRLLDHVREERRPLERIAVKLEGRVLFLKLSEIDWMEADGDHIRFHVGRQTFRHRDTLSRLERRLDPERFLRVHRSAIVNVERIREMQPWFQGDYVIILADGTRLTSGRSYREKVRAFVQSAM